MPPRGINARVVPGDYFSCYVTTVEPLYGWDFSNQPSDPIASNTTRSTATAALKDGAVRTLKSVNVDDNGFIDLGTLMFGGSFTLEFFFKNKDLPGIHPGRLFSCSKSDGTTGIAVTVGDSLVTIGVFENPTHYHSVSVNVVYTDWTKWTHLVVAVNATKVVVYVNGHEPQSKPANETALTLARDDCHVGVSTVMGEMRVFNVYEGIMTSSEVNERYTTLYPDRHLPAVKLFSWDFKVISYADWGSSMYAPCTNPSPHNGGMVNDYAHPPEIPCEGGFSGLKSQICSPYSNSPNFGTPGHRAGCSPYPAPPDYTGNDITHAEGTWRQSVGGGSTACVMRCVVGDSKCPTHGASTCAYPAYCGGYTWIYPLCTWPVTATYPEIAVYYSTSTYASTQPTPPSPGPYPVVSVLKGMTFESRGVRSSSTTDSDYTGITSNLGNIPGFSITGDTTDPDYYTGVSIEMQVYVNSGLPLGGSLLTCTASSGHMFQLTFDVGGKLSWTAGGYSVSGGTVSTQKNHIVVTVPVDGDTTLYLDKVPSTGTSGLIVGPYENCNLGKGVDVTLSSFHIYRGVMTADEVHTAFHHCAEEAPAPAPDGVPATEEQGMSASTVVAVIAAALVYSAALALSAAAAVSLYGKRRHSHVT